MDKKQIINDINNLKEAPRIIVKTYIDVVQSSLLDFVSDLEDIKKEIKVEEKNAEIQNNM